MLKDHLIKVGLKKRDIDNAPKLTEVVQRVKGGIPAVIEALRFSSHPEAIKFMEVWNNASITDRKLLPLEAFALMGQVNIEALLGAIIFALANHYANIVKVMTITNHPDTMQARIESAQIPGSQGKGDRDAIDMALGFLPQPKGTVNVFNIGGTRRVPENETLDPSDIDQNELFPDLLETQKLLPE